MMESSGPDILVALIATALALGGLSYAGFRLMRSLLLFELVKTAAEYPNVSMVLALSARGDKKDSDAFRSWLVSSIENIGWEQTDVVVATMLSHMGVGTSDPVGVGTKLAI